VVVVVGRVLVAAFVVVVVYLDELVSLKVDRSRSLIENKNARSLEQRARHADQLALTHAQVRAALVDWLVETLCGNEHRHARKGLELRLTPWAL